MHVIPSGSATHSLGARVTGVDLTRPLTHADFGTILRALGRHKVLCFPDQLLTPVQLRELSARFGELQILPTSLFNEPGVPEVSILSNVVENGKPIGAADAGQSWHTDMSYNALPLIGFVNILVAHAVPVRAGQPLGGTEFTDVETAYAELPADLKTRLADARAVHDWAMYWDMMRAKGSNRPALTPAQRAQHPPVEHPVFMTHPVSGNKVIYVNPGFTSRIVGMDAAESAAVLEALFAHVFQARYRHTHHWSVGDVLLWDHIGTWHNAIADYTPAEARLMKRCQVMADKILDPAFVAAALA